VRVFSGGRRPETDRFIENERTVGSSRDGNENTFVSELLDRTEEKVPRGGGTSGVA